MLSTGTLNRRPVQGETTYGPGVLAVALPVDPSKAMRRLCTITRQHLPPFFNGRARHVFSSFGLRIGLNFQGAEGRT